MLPMIPICAARPLFVHSLSCKYFCDHVTHDTHLCCSAIVQFYIKLTCFLFWVLDVFTEPAYTVVSVVFGCWYPCKFYKTEEKEDLCKTCSWDCADSVDTGWDI